MCWPVCGRLDGAGVPALSAVMDADRGAKDPHCQRNDALAAQLMSKMGQDRLGFAGGQG